MGKAKGKVNEQSLEALKKSIKAGGKSARKKQQPKEQKTATATVNSRASRSQSRSRTSGRLRKSPPLSSRPVPEKKAVVRKAAAAAGKVKRLDDDKPASKKGRPRGRPSSNTATVTATSAKSPGSYKLRPRIPSSEDDIGIKISIQEASREVVEVNNISGTKASSPVVSGNNSGWFSKCIIS